MHSKPFHLANKKKTYNLFTPTWRLYFYIIPVKTSKSTKQQLLNNISTLVQKQIKSKIFISYFIG